MTRITGPKLQCILCMLNTYRSSKRQGEFTILQSIKYHKNHIDVCICILKHRIVVLKGDFKDGLNNFSSTQSFPQKDMYT